MTDRTCKYLLKAAAVLALILSGCTSTQNSPEPEKPEETALAETASAEAVDAVPEKAPAEKTGDITILFTSDIHCGVKEGFGVVGLQQIRETLEKNGMETLLVDDGDAVQGDALGTITKGKAIITLMNDLHYDVVIPGNHEFGYGMDEFFELVDMAEFPYISCNFNKQGEFPFDPYVIKEAAGKKDCVHRCHNTGIADQHGSEGIHG